MQREFLRMGLASGSKKRDSFLDPMLTPLFP